MVMGGGVVSTFGCGIFTLRDRRSGFAGPAGIFRLLPFLAMLSEELSMIVSRTGCLGLYTTQGG